MMENKTMKIFSLRTSGELIKEADKLAKLEKTEKSFVLREAMKKGLVQMKLEIAIKLFAEGKLTIGESANIAGISVGEMMEKLRELGIDSRISKEDLRETFQNALEIIK